MIHNRHEKTAAVVKPVFQVSVYLRDLIRRSRGQGEPVAEEILEPPPFAPTSSFVTADDKVIECEVYE
jgi:hypothetical protein